MSVFTGLTVAEARKILQGQGVKAILFRMAAPPRDPPEQPGDDYRVLLVKMEDPETAIFTVCKPVESKGTEPDGQRKNS